jgi:TP901 family phage tail tape measure protein
MAGTRWTLDLKDNLTSKLKGVKKGFSDVRKESDRIPASVDQLRKKLDGLEKAKNKSFSTKEIVEFNRQIRQTQAELGRLNNKGIGGKLGGLGKQLQGSLGIGLGGLGAAGGVLGAIAIGKSAIRSMMELEKAMSNVKAITGATDVEFKALNDTAIKLGGSTAFTAKQVADGMAYLGMAGFKTKEIIQAMPQVLNLAAAGNMDLAKAADIASNIMGQFGISAANTDRVVNVLAATAASSNTNIEQLAEAMKYLGPTSKALGMSVEETAAIVGVLGDAGIQGSMAGRALGSSLVNLANPTKKVQTAMKQMGLNVFDANGQFVGMRELLRQIEVGTANMTQQQRAANLTMLLGNEAFQEINILLERGSVNYDKFAKSITDSNKAQEMAVEQMNNLAGEITKLESAWDGFIQGLNGSDGIITGILKGAISLTKDFVEGLKMINKGAPEAQRERIMERWKKEAEEGGIAGARLQGVQDDARKMVTVKYQDSNAKNEKEAAEMLIKETEAKYQQIEEQLNSRLSKAVGVGSGRYFSSDTDWDEAEKAKMKILRNQMNETAIQLKALQRLKDDLPGGKQNTTDKIIKEDEAKAEKGIGHVKGEGVKHLVMNVHMNNTYNVRDGEDRNVLRNIGEEIASFLVDAGRDALITLGD